MTTERIRGLADAAGLVLLARLMAAVGVPLALGVATYAGAQFIETARVLERLQTAILVGLEPRISGVEQEIKVLRADVAARAQSRFDRADGDRLEARIQAQIERLEAELRGLRQAIDGRRQG